jgi:hypothetical protein
MDVLSGNDLNPFGLSLSKPCPSFVHERQEGQPLDMLRVNGLLGAIRETELRVNG